MNIIYFLKNKFYKKKQKLISYNQYPIENIFPKENYLIIENFKNNINNLIPKFNIDTNKLIELIYELCPRKYYYPYYFKKKKVVFYELSFKSKYYLDLILNINNI